MTPLIIQTEASTGIYRLSLDGKWYVEMASPSLFKRFPHMKKLEAIKNEAGRVPSDKTGALEN